MKVDNLSLGCWYEACEYYKLKHHPRTGRICKGGNPACLKGRIDYTISILLFLTYTVFFSWKRAIEGGKRQLLLHLAFFFTVGVLLIISIFVWVGLIRLIRKVTE